ncbi:MAG: LapA family protein [Thermoleophilia bacterium]
MADEPERPEQNRDGFDERDARRLAIVGGLVLVGSLVLVFIVENSRQVRVSFVFFSAEISLIWMMVLSFAAGAVAGVLGTRFVKKRWFTKE